MRDYSYITRGGYEFGEDCLLSRPKINHSGNHRLNGMMFLYGKNVKQGFRTPDVNIVDLFPTILSIMDVPLPEDLDGKVIRDCFEKEHAV